MRLSARPETACAFCHSAWGGKLFDIVAVFIFDELCLSPVLALAAGRPFRSRSGDMRLPEISVTDRAIEIRCRHVRADIEMLCHSTLRSMITGARN